MYKKIVPFARRGVAVTSLGVLALTGLCAHAAPVALTVTGWAYSGGKVNLTDGAGKLIYNGSAGGFSGSLTGAGVFDSPSFLTYCIELEEGFAFSKTAMAGYIVEGGAAYFGARHNSPASADALGRLMTFVSADPTRVDTAAESTALQLAVWNLVYDIDYSLSSGSLRDTSAFASYANQLLGGAYLTASSAYDVSTLSRSGTQDFLVWTPKPQNPVPPNASVPEPGTLALCGLALVGVFAVGRRQARLRALSALSALSATRGSDA